MRDRTSVEETQREKPHRSIQGRAEVQAVGLPGGICPKPGLLEGHNHPEKAKTRRDVIQREELGITKYKEVVVKKHSQVVLHH